MSKKKILIRPKLELKNIEKNLDEWVTGTSIASNDEEYLKTKETKVNNVDLYRFTLVIPESLHRRIKKYCAVHGCSMKEKLTEILSKEFPAA